MFNEDRDEEKSNSSDENLSEEVDNVLDEPIAKIEPSTAEKEDMENLELKGGNLEQSRLDSLNIFRY